MRPPASSNSSAIWGSPSHSIDFGTGFSSLSYLHRFAFHTLKIDRSFIGDFSNWKRDSTIASAIVALAHALELEVVAEGIETPEQLAFLRAAKCKLGQGWLFGKAMSLKSSKKRSALPAAMPTSLKSSGSAPKSRFQKSRNELAQRMHTPL